MRLVLWVILHNLCDIGVFTLGDFFGDYKFYFGYKFVVYTRFVTIFKSGLIYLVDGLLYTIFGIGDLSLFLVLFYGFLYVLGDLFGIFLTRIKKDHGTSVLLFTHTRVLYKGVGSTIYVGVGNGFSLQRATTYKRGTIGIRRARDFIVFNGLSFALGGVGLGKNLVVYHHKRGLQFLYKGNNISFGSGNICTTRYFGARQGKDGVGGGRSLGVTTRGTTLGDYARYGAFVQIGTLGQLFTTRFFGNFLGYKGAY